MFIAHKNENTGKQQTVQEHCQNTAELCKKFSINELKDLLYMIGLFHDIGKYQESFQKRIAGQNIQVEHSICGAVAAKDLYDYPINIIMEYCIAGHHSGLPDAGSINDTPDMSTLNGRMKREMEVFNAYQQELAAIPMHKIQFIKYLLQDCENDKDKLVDKFAFLTRYCFSCLIDADTIDTAKFCGTLPERPLKADFTLCLKKIDEKLTNFMCVTELQKTRANLQKQVFEKVNVSSEIFLMNMPTGSGKTLCSMKFALERAIRSCKKRIIYIIPYNSIIDQTAQNFENTFGEAAELLRHQSTFSIEDGKEGINEDYYQIVKSATENWDAQIIITTAVQFFESVYGNKRAKLRKLHNMSDSILVLDEAHLMPTDFLQPCLQAVSYITKYLNSEAVFLTATMPDFSQLFKKYALTTSKILNLIHDTSNFGIFNKCKYSYCGDVSDEALIEKAKAYPSSLIIVNKRSTARTLFSLCTGHRYHLSTYMTADDRIRVINTIKEDLSSLERDYPDLTAVPDERRITVISTSLIEAGVDLDIFTVFRELWGLDSILQAGGRCNREGKRERADVFIFHRESEKNKVSIDERCNVTRSLIDKYRDISCSDSINEYYNRMNYLHEEDISKNTMHEYTKNIESIPFKEYADKFELISTNTVSVVVGYDSYSEELIRNIKYTGVGNVRKLQKYTFTMYQYEFDNLLRQHVIEEIGSGIWCLTNPDYYDRELGILFEAKDYFIE